MDNNRPEPLPNGRPPADLPPATLDAVLGELRRIRCAVQAQAAELLDARAAATMLGLSRSTFFRLVAAGKLPKPIRLGEQLRRWRRRTLLDALDAL
jgi:predicted DNA-binding transcriptional regulator AlpA